MPDDLIVRTFVIRVDSECNMSVSADSDGDPEQWATVFAAAVMLHHYAQRAPAGYEAALDEVREIAMECRKGHSET